MCLNILGSGWNGEKKFLYCDLASGFSTTTNTSAETFFCGLVYTYMYCTVLYHITMGRVVFCIFATHVVIAYSLESVRPGLVHGDKAHYGVG